MSDFRITLPDEGLGVAGRQPDLELRPAYGKVYFRPVGVADRWGREEAVELDRDRLTPYRIYQQHYDYMGDMGVVDDHGEWLPYHSLQGCRQLCVQTREPQPIRYEEGLHEASERLRHLLDGMAVLAHEANTQGFAREARIMVRRWERSIDPVITKIRKGSLFNSMVRYITHDQKAVNRYMSDFMEQVMVHGSAVRRSYYDGPGKIVPHKAQDYAAMWEPDDYAQEPRRQLVTQVLVTQDELEEAYLSMDPGDSQELATLPAGATIKWQDGEIVASYTRPSS